MNRESSRIGSPGDLFDTYDMLAHDIVVVGMPAVVTCSSILGPSGSWTPSGPTRTR